LRSQTTRIATSASRLIRFASSPDDSSVSDLADLDRLYAAVKAERGTLDIVFANAGAGSQLPLGKITAERIDETFDTNVKGTIFTVQQALPLMGEGGSIILTGSSAGTTGAPAMSAYSASKAAVRNLARTWAEDLKGTGIRVNVLSIRRRSGPWPPFSRRRTAAS
jgi:NAD(P)-dependent dehydrogenase (short-subunit alcohol dehydrogenase family)